MKSTLFTICLLLSSFAFAQVDVEERMDNIPMADNSSTSVRYNIRGVYQLKDENCADENYKSVKYPGGTNAYTKALYKKLADYVNWDIYTVNGYFYATISINKKGEVSHVEAGPIVSNADLFLSELKEAVKKVKTKWTPATCNGKPVESKAIIKLDLSSISFDTNTY